MLVNIQGDGTSTGAVIVVKGDVGLLNADDLKTAILLAIAAGHTDIAFDLDEVTHIDSIGLGVLASGSDYVRARKGDYRVLRASPRVVRMLELTGLDKIISVPADEDAMRRTG